jgi:hypothetical protein
VPAPEHQVKIRQLTSAYDNDRGNVVAYIDETYLAPSRMLGPVPFYYATAFVIEKRDQQPMRDDLVAIVGKEFWHTTQAHQSEEGRAKIRELADYIGEGTDAIVVAKKCPVDVFDRDAERARAECMTSLLSALSCGAHCETVSLAIFEERKFMPQRNADESTIKAARRGGLIDRNMRVLPTSPTYERLLWLPDVVSFALYQQATNSGHDYLTPYRGNIKFA